MADGNQQVLFVLLLPCETEEFRRGVRGHPVVFVYDMAGFFFPTVHLSRIHEDKVKGAGLYHFFYTNALP